MDKVGEVDFGAFLPCHRRSAMMSGCCPTVSTSVWGRLTPTPTRLMRMRRSFVASRKLTASLRPRRDRGVSAQSLPKPPHFSLRVSMHVRYSPQARHHHDTVVDTEPYNAQHVHTQWSVVNSRPNRGGGQNICRECSLAT